MIESQPPRATDKSTSFVQGVATNSDGSFLHLPSSSAISGRILHECFDDDWLGENDDYHFRLRRHSDIFLLVLVNSSDVHFDHQHYFYDGGFH